MLEVKNERKPVKSQLQSLSTPLVVVDRAILDRNISKAAALAGAVGAKLRPHVKSHKSVAIAKMQMRAGAHGITVSKASEAMPFIEAGIPDITVAYPLVDRRKIGGLLDLAAAHRTLLTLIADSAHGVAAIAAEATARGAVVKVQVKVDVGLHRCGVDPSTDAAEDLARKIADRPSLRFAGILSHAGHAYMAATPEAVRAIALKERLTMLEVADRIERCDIAVASISIGSTPTVWLNDGLEGVTELRPGNYVFMDLTQTSLGVAAIAEIALSVVATVVSCNDTYAIVDAGSKTLSCDRGPHGSTRLSGYGQAFRLDSTDNVELPVVSLSEEHGFVAHGGQRLQVGERLRILPNHACTVVNLARAVAMADQDGTHEIWPVDAQACVS